MFENLKPIAPDPILGLMAAYASDSNPDKVDLGVGVYRDTSGQTPIMSSVKRAEQLYFGEEQSKVYTAPEGVSGFNEALQALVFGEAHSVIRDQRVTTVQTPGGCGALRVAAELVKRSNAGAKIWLGNPTWANHQPLLGNAGIELCEYPYYDPGTGTILFEAMLAALQHTDDNDIVLLHACCHNPTGADLDETQWQQLATLAQEKGFTPFIDMAYQGFAKSVDADAGGIRLMADRLPELLVATSCSKNFALYRERVGALSVVTANAESTRNAQRQILNIARSIYSMPPAHGAALANAVLQDTALRSEWEQELTAMRERMAGLRQLLVTRLAEGGGSERFNFIGQQYGMFSLLGIGEQQVKRLRDEYAIYMTNDSRINIAGINEENVGYLASAILAVCAG